MIDTKGMTKEQKIQAAWDGPALTDSHMLLIRESGFMTGSRVYGDPGTAQDEDWVVQLPPHVFEKVAICAGANEYWAQKGMAVLYAHRHARLVNLMCIGNTDIYRAWKNATAAMVNIVEMYEQDLCVPNGRFYGEVIERNKWARVRLFRALLDIGTPVTPLLEPIDIAEAFHRGVCSRCGREAANFTNADAKWEYKKTGICERCSTGF